MILKQILIIVIILQTSVSYEEISFTLNSKFTNSTSINHENTLQKRSKHAESPLFEIEDQLDYFCTPNYYPSRMYLKIIPKKILNNPRIIH